MSRNFAVIGVGGYIAPRHLQAIYATGNRVVCALDAHDSVGILDRFSPDIHFFTEFERFDRHVEKHRRTASDRRVDFVSICSPNYLHDAHIRFALRVDADAICEKPLVLNPWNIDALQELEAESGRRVFCVLQLREHEAIRRLRQEHDASSFRKHDISLTYVTSRGRWYLSSWKGQDEKSGGVTTNIGIHFFDMLMWIFGGVVENRLHLRTEHKAGGLLELERARIRWFLSIDRDDMAHVQPNVSQVTHRSLLINGKELEFSKGFTELHTQVYNRVLEGKGYRMDDARASIELAHQVRTIEPVGFEDVAHPLTKRALEQYAGALSGSRNSGGGPGRSGRQRDPSLAL